MTDIVWYDTIEDTLFIFDSLSDMCASILNGGHWERYFIVGEL